MIGHLALSNQTDNSPLLKQSDRPGRSHGVDCTCKWSEVSISNIEQKGESSFESCCYVTLIAKDVCDGAKGVTEKGRPISRELMAIGKLLQIQSQLLPTVRFEELNSRKPIISVGDLCKLKLYFNRCIFKVIVVVCEGKPLSVPIQVDDLYQVPAEFHGSFRRTPLSAVEPLNHSISRCKLAGLKD